MATRNVCCAADATLASGQGSLVALVVLVQESLKFMKTRVHSSRMRAARALIVSPSMLCGWGVPGPGGWYPSMH